MKIIFNADDFGYSKAVNLGILEAYQNGLVRSTTIMAGMPGFDHAARLAKDNPGLHIGVHLTLSAGKSVGGVYQTITDAEGGFLRLTEVESKARAGELDLSEVEREYEAQIQKILNAGIRPDHFDGHHHTQNLPGVVTVLLRLAQKYGVMVRVYDKNLLADEFAGVRTTADFDDTFYNERATVDDLRRILSSYSGSSLEIMCHPAYVDHTLYTNSSYNVKRVFELDVLTDEAMKAFIREQGHTLCSFSDI